jgi:lactobin A/cerein 7B family class IIb bacteriocin
MLNLKIKIMKKSESTKTQLIELNYNELTEVKGGFWQAALAIIGAAIYVYNNAEDFAKGFKEGMKQ